jgi:class 3 adenylate cyclase
MKFIEKFIVFLFPNLRFSKKSWFEIWSIQEREEFYSSARVFFGLAVAVYILHYFTVDRAEGLAPSDLWFNYRFGMASIAAACFLFYSTKWSRKFKYFKIPTLVACAIFCYFQSMTIVWYAKVPYLYSFAFVLISAMIIRSTVLISIVYALGLLTLIWPVLLQSGQSQSMMFSASVVTLIFIVYMKAKYVSDLNLFIANQNNVDSQKKIIEINMEFTNQIKSFLPAEIAKRLTYNVQEQRMSVLQATDEVLRPRRATISCLFSDIRGFTKSSSDLNGFVSQSLLPNLKASTSAVERFNGISRKIGDLIFAYFDSEDDLVNTRNAVRSAVELSMLNAEMNQSVPAEMRVTRFILVACGEAIVGNLSGYNSSIEITAIGQPVNLLSRLDEVTKIKSLRDNLIVGDIILVPEIYIKLKSIYNDIDVTMISLESLNIKVRDFEDVKEIYTLPLTKKNHRIIFESDSDYGIKLEAA